LNLTTIANCPVCCQEMQFCWETKEIPYFGEAMVISGVCSCGFRHSDTILLTQKEASRYTLEVAAIEDLDARVIRSSSGTIRVPELGIDIEPGYASESYISQCGRRPGQDRRYRGLRHALGAGGRKCGEHKSRRSDPGEDRSGQKGPVQADLRDRGSSGKQRRSLGKGG